MFYVGEFSCGTRFLELDTPFGPPAFPEPITANNPTANQCIWRSFTGTGRVQLKIFYFDIPESNDCSQNSLKIYNNFVNIPGTLFQTLCGKISQYVFVSPGNGMSVVLDIGNHTGYRGFHAVFEAVN